MKRSENVWRRRAGLLGVAAVFLLGNLGFLIGSRSIRAARKEALENRRASLTTEVLALEGEAKKLVEQRERLAQVSSAIEEFYGRRVGSQRETLAPLVEEIHAVMKKNGVSPGTISYSTAPVPDLPLSQMSIGFSFQSDYARFKRLLNAFEANRKWIVIREVSLSGVSEATGEVQVHLVLGTYFSNGEKAAASVLPVEARRTVRSVERTVER